MVVPNIKDINFWEQFTTNCFSIFSNSSLFRISKISTFESNSQLILRYSIFPICCSEYQRYQLLRAIHNAIELNPHFSALFRISKISTFESNSQQIYREIIRKSCCSEYQRYQLLRAIHNDTWWDWNGYSVVPNIKDINFWEQFTTSARPICLAYLLFRISKISTFESNSQLLSKASRMLLCCSEYQRYQLLRAIHN